MTGIICVDKPRDFTSFDVVAKVRGITRCRKVGHGGTLDPMATGVLPLFFGRATKALDIMPVQGKRYTAAFRLGITTDTQDITGKTLTTDGRPVTRAELETALPVFRGEIDQLPPMYSAVWVDGRRLYDLARQGLEVERPTRKITVHTLELLDYDSAAREGVLEVSCSKGAYIRTIIHDIGQQLGCGGVLTALRRTQALGYTLDCCHTLEQLQELAAADRLAGELLPVDTVFTQLPRVSLTPVQAKMLRNGVRLDTRRIAGVTPELGHVTVWQDDRFLATANIDHNEHELIMERLFSLEQ